jgi:hypothetical protein
MKASFNNRIQIVELLLKFGAKPNIMNQNGDTALTLACMQENLQICERLIVAQADVNQLDN